MYNSKFFSIFRVVKLLLESNFRNFSSTSKENLYLLIVTPHFPVCLPTLRLHKQILALHVTSPRTFVINNLLVFPRPCPCSRLKKAQWSSPKPCSFGFEMINPDLTQGPQSISALDSNKEICLGPVSLSLVVPCLDIPIYQGIFHIFSRTCNKLLFQFSLWTSVVTWFYIWHLVSHLTNVNKS